MKDLDSEESFRRHFETHSRVRDIQGHQAKVHSVDWNCDGKRLASGSYDRTVSVYSLERDRLSKDLSFKGHTDSVDQLCWHSKHPDLLVTASLDKSVRFWDSRTNRCVSNITTKGENINICWSPDGKTVAVGNKEDVVSFIDVKTKKVKHDQAFKFEVNEICWNNENDLFFLTSGTGHVHILSYPSLQAQMVLTAHPATCICIEFDKVGKNFAVGSADAMVSIWDATNMACLRTMNRLEWPVRTISFSHDGKLIASASEDLLIDICHVETGARVGKIPTESPTFTVAFHPKKYLLAYACDDKDQSSYGDRSREAGNVKIFGFQGES
jgi:THO complex subunit 3